MHKAWIQPIGLAEAFGFGLQLHDLVIDDRRGETSLFVSGTIEAGFGPRYKRLRKGFVMGEGAFKKARLSVPRAEALRQNFLWQSAASFKLGSPLYGSLLAEAADLLGAGGDLDQSRWTPGRAFPQVICLLCAGREPCTIWRSPGMRLCLPATIPVAAVRPDFSTILG